MKLKIVSDGVTRRYDIPGAPEAIQGVTVAGSPVTYTDQGNAVVLTVAAPKGALVEVTYNEAERSPGRLPTTQYDGLVQDAELEEHELSVLSYLATRASQESVDNLGAALAPVISGLFPVGTVREFRANEVPEGYEALEGTTYVASGGVAITSAAGSGGASYAVACYVAEGPAPGIWRLSVNKLQRFDEDLNVPVGPEYTVPAIHTSNGAQVGLAGIGAEIYMCGFCSAANGETALHYKFNTGTGEFTQLVSYPSTIGGPSRMTRSVVLEDGRILSYASYYAGATNTNPASVAMCLFNPATPEVAPVRVDLAVPLSKPSGSTSVVMQVLEGDGRVLMVDAAAPTSGNLQSCLLTVVGNTITASAAEDTGQAIVQSVLIPTSSGALFGSNGWRAYTPGEGWSAATKPWAYGSTGTAGQLTCRMPGKGWLVVGTNSSAISVYVFMTGRIAVGSTTVKAVRTA